MIDGIYKVVHHGYDRSVAIATSAFAGCIRVARCSVDYFGTYSEPLLIEPLGHFDGQEPEDHSSSPSPYSGAPGPSGGSQELQMTMQRLGELVRSHYPDASVFQRIYGVPTDSLQVSARLEAMRTNARSANYELSLLLVGLTNLRKQLAQVHVASEWYAEELACVLALERFVPELDHSPVRFAPVIGQMHQLAQVRMTWSKSRLGGSSGGESGQVLTPTRSHDT